MESYELPEITAIEGAVIEGDKLLVAHDGAFRDVIPSDNMIASYNLPYDAPQYSTIAKLRLANPS